MLLLLPVIAVVTSYRDWPTNRAKRLAESAEKADLVKVYRLQGVPSQFTPNRFPILPYDSEHPTFGKLELREDDLKTFLGVWEGFPVNDTSGAMCHFPVYGFQFYRKREAEMETSLCWTCENFYVDTRYFGSNWIGFDSGSEVGRTLLEFCDELLPYDRGYQERIAKEREALIRSFDSTEAE
jgi:hypothetical protein